MEWDGDEPGALAARLREAAPSPAGVGEEVAEIVEAVRARGDEAVLELEERFGAAAPDRLRVEPREVERARAALDAGVAEALELCARNVARVAEAELAGRPAQVDLGGHTVAVQERPVGAAGVYAPGGRAAYPSSVLMCAVPARVAGVRRVALASPPGEDGAVHPAVLGACAVAGVDEVYAMGGAQAVAALALGTESVEAVDVVAGPGNRYVTEAKRRLVGEVGIDALAGPSELAIVADSSVGPRPLALDLLAQAEHGDEAMLFALSADGGLLDRLAGLVESLAAERPGVAGAALALVRAPDAEAALALADAIAPEHLELAVEGGEDLAAGRVAGCVLTGPGGATAFADYAAGSNHVLPTGGAARFSGPLGPRAFMRRTSVVSISREGAAALAPAVDALARAEGLPVHGESALARVTDNEG